MKKISLYVIIGILIVIIVILSVLFYRESSLRIVEMESRYNLALAEVAYHIDIIYEQLGIIVKDEGNQADELTHIWKKVNLARIYMAHLPTTGHGLRTS